MVESKRLDYKILNLNTMLNYPRSLNHMTEQFNIHLICMPGHRNISGNCRADKLVMLGTTLQMQRSLETVDIALANLKLIMLQNAVLQLTNRWTSLRKCINCKKFSHS